MPYTRKGQYLFPIPWRFGPRQRHVVADNMVVRATAHAFGASAFSEPREADVIDLKGKRKRVRYKARIPWGRKKTKLILTDGETIIVKYTKDLPQIA